MDVLAVLLAIAVAFLSAHVYDLRGEISTQKNRIDYLEEEKKKNLLS